MISLHHDFDGKKLIVSLERMPDSIRSRIAAALRKELIELTKDVKQNYLTGQSLHVRSGRLRRSITYRVDSGGTRVVGTVGTNVVYARIHEFGGQTAAHLIIPNKKRVLAWFDQHAAIHNNGKLKSKFEMLAFSRFVHHPGSKIPARPFLGPAFKDRLPSILAAIREAVNGGGK